MKRRIFLRSGSASAVTLALAACGGGGSDAPTPDPQLLKQKPSKTTTSTSSGTTTTTTTTTSTSTTTSPTTTTTTTSPTTTTSSTLPVYSDGTSRINSMLAASLNVAIPDGIYMITGTLNVLNGQTISPVNAGQVVLKAAPSYTGAIISTSGPSFTISGIIFDGAYSDRLALEGSTNATLIQVSGGSNVTLKNNTFQYAPSYGIWVWNSGGMQILGNTFLECWQSIRMDGNNLPSAGTIDTNTFTNTSAYRSIQHIEAMATVNLVVSNNTMQGAGLLAPTNPPLEGTWGNSIYIWNSTGHLVQGNKVYTNHWSAVVSGQGATYGTIRNNYFSDGTNSACAVWIEQPGCAYHTVDSNTMDGSIEVGDSGGDHCTITNNTIRSRSSYAINVNAAAKDVLIQNNQISSRVAGSNIGVYLWQKTTTDVNTRLFYNTITGFAQGVAIDDMGSTGTVYGITLSGNIFTSDTANIFVPSTITLNQPLGQ